MIWDHWHKFSLYRSINPLFAAVEAFQQKTPIEQLAVGRYEIVGSDCFVMIQEYHTRAAEGIPFEAHRKYLDIQVMLAGEERMGLLPLAEGVPGEYDESRDYLPVTGEGDWISFRPGYFTIFYPQDGHLPGIQPATGPGPARKAVFKVLV